MIVTTRGWTDASITWTHTAGAATFAPGAPDRRNAYERALTLRDWLDNAARPWAAAISSVTLTVGTDGKRHRFTYSFTGSTPTFVSIAPNAAWIAVFGDTSQVPAGVCRASLGVDVDSIQWDRVEAELGEVSRDGAWGNAAARIAHRRPRVTVATKGPQAFARDEMLRLATEPREAYIYDIAGDAWRLVTLGPHETTQVQDDPTLQQTTFEVLG
jgi:hypothetical protein